jgi:hypothetical protein
MLRSHPRLPLSSGASQLTRLRAVLTESESGQILAAVREMTNRLVLAAQSPFTTFSRVEPRQFMSLRRASADRRTSLRLVARSGSRNALACV